MTVTDEFSRSADDAERFASLVPQLAVEMAVETGNHHRTIEGSMLSADISGFTALSEKLAAKGKAGAEEITQLINICFTELIDAAYAYGGEVIKFGGDALLVLFRGEDHLTRVAAAGLDMQHALHSSPAAKKANLTMTVGASEGPFEAFLVGSSQRDLIISGANASHVIHLEGEAEKGDTVVSNAIADALPDTLRVAPHAGGWIISGDIDQETSGPNERTTQGVDLATLVPESVGTHFEGFAGLGGEHRIVTVGFLSVSGLDEHLDDHGTTDTRDALGELVDAVVESCAEFGVTPLHTDIAPNGLKFVLCAGAPYTEGNTSEAMLEAALRITKLSTPFTVKVGVQRGRVFAGFLGSPFRRTYTLMGDPVNTAARMLGKAANKDIVAVDDVLSDTRTIYAAEEIEPFLVKGKTEPMRASYVFGTTDWVQRQAPLTPLIGRDEELSTLTRALDSDENLLQVVAPAGAGKSRLLDEFRRETERLLMRRIEAHCSPYSSSTPYALLQMVVRSVADIEGSTDPLTAGELLHKSVRHHVPELTPLVPILAIPAGAEVEATPESEAIDPKFLRDQIHDVTSQFLQSALEPNVVFVLEDLHWIDDASADFLEFALTQRRGLPWTSVVTSRPTGSWTLDRPDVPTIQLEPLTRDQIRKLVIDASAVDLSDTAIEVILDRSAGNPLFVLELTRVVSATGADSVPDSVEQLIATRLDELEPNARQLLRVASVFGRNFTLPDLRAVIDEDPSVVTELDEFVEMTGPRSLRFIHAIFRDVAYEGLPFSQRTQLHATVGNRLEEQASNPEAIAALLAEHFSIAEDHERTWRYGRLAGERAAALAANTESIDGYQRALEAAQHLDDLNMETVVQTRFSLGEVLVHAGQFDDAITEYELGLHPLAGVPAVDGLLKIAEVKERQGRYDEAIELLDRADMLLPADKAEARSQRTKSHYIKSGIRHRLNDQQGCIVSARLALGYAEDEDDLEGMALALQRLHLATVYLGREDRIGYGPKSREFFTTLGKYDHVSGVLNNMGIEAYFAGRWSDAADFYREGRDAGVRAGSMVFSMLGAANSAEILSDQGRWDEAIELLEGARRNWQAGGYAMGLALVKLYLGIAHDRRGDFKLAQSFLDAAAKELSELGLNDEAEDASARLLISQVHTGDTTFSAIRERLEANPEHPARARLIHAATFASLTEGREERSFARSLLGDIVEDQAGYERGLTLRLISHIDGEDANGPSLTEAQEIFDSLGVVRLRELPPLPLD